MYHVLAEALYTKITSKKIQVAVATSAISAVAASATLLSMILIVQSQWMLHH